MHPSRTSGAPVAYSLIYVARHQKEQELGTVRSGRRRSGFVVELRISSAAAN